MANRLSHYGLLLVLPSLLLASTASAQAPQRERVALHPCVITGGKKADNTQELEAVCTTAAIRETMDLVPSNEVTTFFTEEACATAKDKAACLAKLATPPKGARAQQAPGSCAKAKNRDACLGRLATATKATRTLYITLNPYTTKTTRITGIVVDTKGKRVEDRTMELPRIPSQSPRDVIRFAVAQLLEKLEVAKAPVADFIPPSLTGQPDPEPEPIAQRPVAPTPPPAATPAPPAITAQPEPPRGRTWKTPAGIAGMVVGVAGVGLAGYLVSSSNSKADDFNSAYADGKRPAQADLPRLDQLRDDVKSQRSTATLSAGVGGALAVGGLILFLVDRPSSEATPAKPKAGSARILAGPRQVGLLVVLP
ncbi:hypothetical protein [Hyalangium rubrum]|uniref:Uncharacterized protein n=1 Tax=Hyalangium rubrum TaxID=3103134 RepID=A0ABU5H6E6_9BACT|nr:hypothetical protein [Hyalangium sp. s54d21]MDY7227665.1 hypothetical protein [Hyalangium sp. s54d21]